MKGDLKIRWFQDKGSFPRSLDTSGGADREINNGTKSWGRNFWSLDLIEDDQASVKVVRGWRWVMKFVRCWSDSWMTPEIENIFKDWQLAGDLLEESVSGCDWMETRLNRCGTKYSKKPFWLRGHAQRDSLPELISFSALSITQGLSQHKSTVTKSHTHSYTNGNSVSLHSAHH